VETTVKEKIDRFFFEDSYPLGVFAARTVLAIQALWIVVSRPGMSQLTAWPQVFWAGTAPLQARFAIFPGADTVDRVLYWVLVAALAAVLFGIVPRIACFVSAILLYHFAPMEAVMGGLPYTASLSGLTLPLMGMLILAFSNVPRLRAAPSADYRWPLRLIQIIFVFHYVNSGLAKLHWAGIRWYSTENVGHLAVGFWMLDRPTLSLYVWQRPWLATAIGVGVFILEFGFVLTLFSKWARRILLPLAVFAFLLRIQVFGFFFMSFPSLFVMANWDAIALWWERRKAHSTTIPASVNAVPANE
jgi:hypothetical protein